MSDQKSYPEVLQDELDCKSLASVYGDPVKWEFVPCYSAEGQMFTLYRCPQCGAAAMNAYQHKAWHIQFDQAGAR